MDRTKWIVLGVLVLLLGAMAMGRNTDSESTHADHAHVEGDGHEHFEGDGHDHSADASAANESTPPAANTAAKGPSTPNATKLQKTDLKVGKGKTAKTGNAVQMHYRGMLTNGTVFDESYKRGQPLPVTLGAGEVIQGWDEGIPGMKEGGKRKLVIPPDMAYGAAPPPGAPIPPNATLVFEVELIKVG